MNSKTNAAHHRHRDEAFEREPPSARRRARREHRRARDLRQDCPLEARVSLGRQRLSSAPSSEELARVRSEIAHTFPPRDGEEAELKLAPFICFL